MRKIYLFLLVFSAQLFATVSAQSIFETPLSPRIANYEIQAKLNPQKKTVQGKLSLQWRNTSQDSLRELQFHLYLNAFMNTQTTFMQESKGKFRGDKLDKKQELSWGWIDINSMKMRDGEDLSRKIEFIQPEDGNKNDQTVIRVLLAEPILPDSTVFIDIEFESKLPQIFARTGFSDNYFLVGQWFPKIGVYERAGQRYATKGAWNCHQFHAHSEFYADYGVYDVDINVPEGYVVGATGLLKKQAKKADKTITYTYHAEDVVDFVWTASERFVLLEDEWEHVKIRLLMQPEHAEQATRHFESAKAALAYFDKYLGKYPYPNLTIVDPPFRGSGSGGMEYPTFITVGTTYGLFEGFRLPEMVTVHEFGHQYFMNLLATNEFEEAWLDEGFNSYYENRIMDETYGEKTSMVDTRFFGIGDVEMARSNYAYMHNPKKVEVFRAAWEYPMGGYSTMSYSKTATWMTTLERLLGRETMDEIMKTYFARWKFKHACAKDFISIVNEVVKKNHGNKYGENMDWYFREVLYGNNVCDYSLAAVYNLKTVPKVGVFDKTGEKKFKGYEKSDSAVYEANVRVYRLGEIVMPVEILVHFENGEEEMHYWNGKERAHELHFTGKGKVSWAKIDPENKILIDINLMNNSFTVERPKSVYRKISLKFMFFIQNLFQFFAMFI